MEHNRCDVLLVCYVYYPVSPAVGAGQSPKFNVGTLWPGRNPRFDFSSPEGKELPAGADARGAWLCEAVEVCHGQNGDGGTPAPGCWQPASLMAVPSKKTKGHVCYYVCDNRVGLYQRAIPSKPGRDHEEVYGCCVSIVSNGIIQETTHGRQESAEGECRSRMASFRQCGVSAGAETSWW